MPLYDLYSDTGLQNSSLTDVLYYESQQLPILIPGILFFIYGVVLMASYMGQRFDGFRRSLSLASSIAGLITTVVGIIILAIPDNRSIINLYSVGIAVVFTFLSMLWFLYEPRFNS